MKKIQGSILIISFFSFKDALLQTYTLPFVKIIRRIIPQNKKVYLVCFEKEDLQMTKNEKLETFKNLKGSDNIELLFFPYKKNKVLLSLQFLFIIIPYLFGLIIIKNIKSIHCWGPHAGVLGTILSKVTFRSFILDSCEPHAESMVENGTWKKNSYIFRIMFYFEKLQIRTSRAIIACTAGMKNYIKEKYKLKIVTPFYAKPACVDINKFEVKSRDESLKFTGIDLPKEQKVLIYVGKFGGIYFDKELFALIKAGEEYWGPQNFRAIILTSLSEEDSQKYLDKYNISPEVLINKFVPHSHIPYYMSLADFAVTPVKPVKTKLYCSPIKDGEYWAMGLPVIITPNISDDSAIIEDNNIGVIWDNYSAEGCLKAVKSMDYILKNSDLHKRRAEIRSLAKKYRGFEIAEEVYSEIYENVR